MLQRERDMKSLGAVLAMAVALGPIGAEACGDKFLRVGRGARDQRGYAALYPASIVLYSRPDSPAAQSLRELEPMLKRAGHKVVKVEDARALGPALRNGHFHAVLTDFGEVATVEKAFGDGGPRPAIIPVLHRPTKEALAAAEKAHSCVVKTPGNKSDVLERIDALMGTLTKAESASKK